MPEILYYILYISQQRGPVLLHWRELQELVSQSKFNPFPKWQNSDSSEFKAFGDDSFKFIENGTKFSRWVENTAGLCLMEFTKK